MNKKQIENIAEGKEMDALIAKTFSITSQGEYSTSLFWAIVLVDAMEGKFSMANVQLNEDGMITPLAICRAALLTTLGDND